MFYRPGYHLWATEVHGRLKYYLEGFLLSMENLMWSIQYLGYSIPLQNSCPSLLLPFLDFRPTNLLLTHCVFRKVSSNCWYSCVFLRNVKTAKTYFIQRRLSISHSFLSGTLVFPYLFCHFSLWWLIDLI